MIIRRLVGPTFRVQQAAFLTLSKRMADVHLEFNPCCCISLRTGTTIIAVFEIVYGIAYIFRHRYLESLQVDYREFFPQDIPNPTGYVFMHEMYRTGNYVAMILSSILLIVSTQYLRNYYQWLATLCYSWVLIRSFLIVSFLIYCNALIESHQPHFVRYGYEILANVILHFYFILVVVMYTRDSRAEFNNMRAIKPINIDRADHEEYVINDKKSKFNNATSYHFLTPHFYLSSTTKSENTARLEDESMLYYAIRKSLVLVPSTAESQTSIQQKVPDSIMTLRQPHGTRAGDQDISLMSSQMSVSPADQDRAVVSFDSSIMTTRSKDSDAESRHSSAASYTSLNAVEVPSLVMNVGAIGEEDRENYMKKHGKSDMGNRNR